MKGLSSTRKNEGMLSYVFVNVCVYVNILLTSHTLFVEQTLLKLDTVKYRMNISVAGKKFRSTSAMVDRFSHRNTYKCMYCVRSGLVLS